MAALIDEQLPENSVHADVVLHVRRHLRRTINDRRVAEEKDLALLFGMPLDRARKLGLARALQSDQPISAAAEIIAGQAKGPRVVPLGFDVEHVHRCREWLVQRKTSVDVLKPIIATDLRTLLAISRAIDLAEQSAPTSRVATVPLPILIEGETGTGKELLARAIHTMSARSGKFAVAHVAGLPADLIHDELYGHEKGSFTGASQERAGRVEEADGGTLLIDEVGDLPAIAQVGLLRFLQDHKFSRFGGAEKRLDVRVIAATWYNLDEAVAANKFRRDLLHRIRVERVWLPPLRARENVFQEVVPEILKQLGHKAQPTITRRAMDAIGFHTWDGNMRELTGALRSAAASAGEATVRLEDLPSHIQQPYLRQPIEVRAPGFLSDEFDGQPLRSDLIATKVERLKAELERAPPPDGPPPLVIVREFFGHIPDQSKEHLAIRKSIDAHVELAREVMRLQRIAHVWQTVVASGLPTSVESPVKLELSNVVARLAEAQSSYETSAGAIDLAKDPWFRFCNELAELPMLEKTDRGQLINGVVTAAKVAYSLAPELGAKVKNLIQEGGLKALRKQGMKLLEDDPKEVAELPAGDPVLPEIRNHKLWTREDWKRLVASAPTLVEAAKAADISDKTLRKYLHEFKIKTKRS